uniref:Plastid acyl carrier protein n=1 Tax=Eustigmatophyceae sp. Mont 10/10-1w TaxID=2506145 RepID=A0A451FLE9_9STRA|nr:plastid acyl carrier protein [Eustigmatophyceae sp. Mont 10/10-1w]
MARLFAFLTVLAWAGSSMAFMPAPTCRGMATRANMRPLTVMLGVSDDVRSIILKNSGDDPKVAEYLGSHGDDAAEFTELGFDSLDMVEFSMALQSQFGLADLAEEDLAKFKTVKDVVDHIESEKK